VSDKTNANGVEYIAYDVSSDGLLNNRSREHARVKESNENVEESTRHTVDI
jgi:hypothetical protein